MAVKTPASAVPPATATDVSSSPVRAESLRCNAPQRTPKAPDTPWGRLRGARGWSLRELEQESGINAGALSRIERGTSPTPDQALALLEAYELTTKRTTDLVTLTEAARALGLEPQTLRHAANALRDGDASADALAGRLGIRRVGRDWLLPRDRLEAEVARREEAR